jgi:hypothetical protein
MPANAATERTDAMTMIEGLLLAIFFALVANGWHLHKIREHVAEIRGEVWKQSFGKGQSYRE